VNLTGLIAGPAQVWGSVRLVPLLRPEPLTDLRLHAQLRGDNELSIVDVTPRTSYIAFIPHAFVATWTRDGSPAAAFGTQLAAADATGEPRGIRLRFDRRMARARRNEPERLRFLPLHLAMEGYLALHLGGPSVAWQDWSARALRAGLSPRIEAAYAGTWVPGLNDAMRVFEIHPDQCGMMLYVADALASAFVVGHPDDYRALHPTLVRDMYGELIYRYAVMYDGVQEFRARIDDTAVGSPADLRAAVSRVATEWHTFHRTMAGGLLDAEPSTVDKVYRMAPYTLSRFLPTFDPDRENHIGEAITDDSGRVAYLKTFRLSAAQTKRGHLLSNLARHDWNLDDTAAALGSTREHLIGRMERAGFGALLRQDVLDAARAARRRPPRISRRT
jgi:hypothetical protein